MTEPRWLDEEEMRLWRNLVETVSDVFAALDSELQRDHGLASGDYEVLVFLSEADEHALRMCDLAHRLHLSPSGLTRRLDGLVRAGLVDRRPSANDRRVTLAVLTDAGFAKLRSAAPDHVESVRRHLLDHLSRTQIRQLGAGFQALHRGRDAMETGEAITELDLAAPTG